MECEVCGRIIFGSPRNVTIDGARLTVCSECATLSSSSPKSEKRTRPLTKPLIKRSSPGLRPRPSETGQEMELVQDYSRMIRRAREKLGISQKDFGRMISERASFLQKIETGKTVPDQTLTKKLESALKIKLLVPQSSPTVSKELLVQKPYEATLGDVAYFRKKKAMSEASPNEIDNRT